MGKSSNFEGLKKKILGKKLTHFYNTINPENMKYSFKYIFFSVVFYTAPPRSYLLKKVTETMDWIGCLQAEIYFYSRKVIKKLHRERLVALKNVEKTL